MTIAMLALAGFPVTAGFIGKIYLIDAAVDNDYAWLGVVIVLGSTISLAYYLRVVAAIWLVAPGVARAPAPLVTPGGRPAIAGGSPEADDEEEPCRTARSPERGRRAPVRGRGGRGRLRGADARDGHLPRAAVRRRADAGAALAGLL